MTSLTPHSRRKRPSVGIIFVIISCLSLQFGAAFAVHLFPLFGPWLVTMLRLLLAAITVGAAVWIAGRWRAHRAGAQTAYMAVPAKTSDGFIGWSYRQWRAMLIFGVTLGWNAEPLRKVRQRQLRTSCPARLTASVPTLCRRPG